ncbi:MAG: pyridoxal-phosphate dependent enzyme [Polyangiaceae bacterium]
MTRRAEIPSPAASLRLGRYPTPVERLDELSGQESSLWVKRDDRTNEIYGGNKVRKLERLLADARARGARRIVTVGAAGSHHVLATTYFGARAGFAVEAVLVPQPRTDHVVEVLRAAVGLGMTPFPVSSWAAAVPVIIQRVARGGPETRFFMLGGSSPVGAMGYVSAARELAEQVRAGEIPEPDLCVVALGSGGTAAGLTAGFAEQRMKTKVVGVCVSRPPWALGAAARFLAHACSKRAKEDAPRPHGTDAGDAPARRFFVDARFLGGGYGHATPEGQEATEVAASAGLALDPTYTAKAFASALWNVRARRGRIILYWHTLSSAPMGPLLERAPSEELLPGSLRRLLLPADA